MGGRLNEPAATWNECGEYNTVDRQGAQGNYFSAVNAERISSLQNFREHQPAIIF
jgi:hypothetical protein